MMSHMAEVSVLCEEAKKMEEYGAEAIIIMDSAGAYLPTDVHTRICALVDSLDIAVGFHAHNNLGFALANSVEAVLAGASLVDGSARGFGAGSGNANLEALVAVLEKMGIRTKIELYKILDAGIWATSHFIQELPAISSLGIVGGLVGVFSGFEKPVTRIAAEMGVDPRDILRELGRRKVVAGQEDMILEVAKNLRYQKENE